MRPRYRAECATERSAGLGEVHSSHHLAAIVSAVVLTDASNIEDGISALKQRVTGLAPAGGA